MCHLKKVRYWWNMSATTTDGDYKKKLLPVHPETATSGNRRRKKTNKNGNCKAFCVIRNAITAWIQIDSCSKLFYRLAVIKFFEKPEWSICGGVFSSNKKTSIMITLLHIFWNFEKRCTAWYKLLMRLHCSYDI